MLLTIHTLAPRRSFLRPEVENSAKPAAVLLAVCKPAAFQSSAEKWIAALRWRLWVPTTTGVLLPPHYERPSRQEVHPFQGRAAPAARPLLASGTMSIGTRHHPSRCRRSCPRTTRCSPRPHDNRIGPLRSAWPPGSAPIGP